MERLNPTVKNWLFLASLIAFGMFLFSFIFPWLKGNLEEYEEEALFRIFWVAGLIVSIINRKKILAFAKSHKKILIFSGISLLSISVLWITVVAILNFIESKKEIKPPKGFVLEEPQNKISDPKGKKILTLEEFEALQRS